jgi:YggT family protein
MNFLQQLIRLYSYVIFGRVVLSWFPISPNSPFATIYNGLYSITEPVLGPVRRVMPAMGGWDLSPLIVFFALQLLSSAL